MEKAWFKRDYKRIIFSAFEHGDDWHLYYNMVSFMWKGRELEERVGALRFILILVTFTITTSLGYMGLNCLLATVLDDWSYMRSCAVGFSAVIFALKVLCTHNTHGINSFLGFPVPSKYIFWVELIYISLISPNASFLGHLAGILVGLAYVHGPLKTAIDLIEGMLTGASAGRSHSRRFNSSGTTGDSGSDGFTHSRRFNSSGTTGDSGSDGFTHSRRFNSSGTTGDSDGFDEEEIRRATEESLRNGRPSAPPYPTNDDWSSGPAYNSRWSSGSAYNTRWSSGSQSPPYPTYIHPETEDLRRRRIERFSRPSS